MVIRTMEIVRQRRVVSVEMLAYLLDVSPTTARSLLRAASELDIEIMYDGGVARHVPSSGEPGLRYLSEEDLTKQNGKESGEGGAA